jgi:hypothetical protein
MDAVYRQQRQAYTNPSGPIIRITDYAWACETAVVGRSVAGSHFIQINLPNLPFVQGAPDDIPLGTYTIRFAPYDPWVARVGYRAYDSACATERDAFEAREGTVTVESFQPGTLRASFDVYFTGDLHLAGHFVARRCDSLGWDSNMGNGLCLPPIECTPAPSDGGNVAVFDCH